MLDRSDIDSHTVFASLLVVVVVFADYLTGVFIK